MSGHCSFCGETGGCDCSAMTPPPSTEGLIERLEDHLENAMMEPISDYVPVSIEDVRAVIEALARFTQPKGGTDAVAG